ncbi:hypothetical protein [Halorubrum aethiopicum]|uniref:hypothetical protein n=1 Tax=Halorubrum aethiopicum TaxID=1758255 RepID=UPI000836F0C9|nr:hypothetical protein [Halorubrum aethiopicum]
MSRPSLLGDSDDSPSVDEPRLETDRGLPGFVDASLLAFVATLLALVVLGAVTGDPVTWNDAPGALSNALTAAGVVGGVRWVAERGDGERG